MDLKTGATLGAYEIVGPLGAGAMGAVYRARDPRLGRSVAIKVLSERALLVPRALERFEQEARAASAIAHPNIVTVHEIGQVDSSPYIVMELVEGKSLRQLLSGGALPLKTLLSIAVQIADGLAAAHARAIVHRDLKPENVMVTPGGVVKILDFGLARPTVPSGAPTDSTMASPLRMTEPGMIVGTASYMSPEQARGADVDFRTDQFSFGTVLYEMATGRCAFKRDSAAQTLAAIIQEEPVPVRDLAPASPAPLRWIIERCLAKEREGRYDSTQDLARELHALKEHVSEIGSPAVVTVEPPAARPRGPGKGWMAANAAFALAAITAIVLAVRWHSPKPLPTFKRLTFQRGHVTGARFAPDGQTVIYSAAWEGRPSEIFSMNLSGPESRPIGLSPAQLVGLDQTGQVALLLTPDISDELRGFARGMLAVAPLQGGAPREMRPWVFSADISRDGKAFAAVLARNVGEFRDQIDLEYPLGKKLWSGILNRPRISPDGLHVAVLEFTNAGESLVVVFDREGNRKVLSKGWRNALGPAWSPDGKEVWFSAGGDLPQTLLAADMHGNTRELVRIPPTVFLEDVSPDGRALVKRQERRAVIVCRAPGEPNERDLSWFGDGELAGISRDGKSVLFTERGSGKASVYFRKTDGSPAVRLGGGVAVSLSPDGQWALSQSFDPPTSVALLPTGAGQPRTFDLGQVRLPPKGLLGFAPLVGWSPGGDWILFWGIAPDHSRNLYRLNFDTEETHPIDSLKLTMCGPLSPDGTRVIACDKPGCGLYPLDGGPPRIIPGFKKWWEAIAWDPDGRSFLTFLTAYPAMPSNVNRVHIADGRVEPWREILVADPTGVKPIGTIVISPETGAYAYSYERVLSELYLVEGLR